MAFKPAKSRSLALVKGKICSDVSFVVAGQRFPQFPRNRLKAWVVFLMISSPIKLVYWTIPRGPLSVLKESCSGKWTLPFNIGKKPEEYLETIKKNLNLAKAYAGFSSGIEEKYAYHYNFRSTDRSYQIGDKVAIIASKVPIIIGGAKLLN